jgi:hypothetical protein
MRVFMILLDALGLGKTTPSQLLAFLISRAIDIDDFTSDVFDDNNAAFATPEARALSSRAP